MIGSSKKSKYEYKVIHFGLTSGVRKEDVEVKLNLLGEEGWELTGLTRNDYVVMVRVK